MTDIANPFDIMKGSTVEKEEIPEELNPFRKVEYACTVVSLLPIAIHEDKPHMLPSTFHIPATDGKTGMAIIHVKEGIHYVPNPIIDEGKPGSTIRQVTSPAEMARSICEDYNTAHIATDEDAMPGLYWLEGKMTEAEVRKYYPKELARARFMQNNWFHNLCSMADADWNKNRNMLAVSDLQRAAAKVLGVQREWVNFKMTETTECPFCKMSIHPESIICSNCKQIVNKEKFDSMGGKIG